MPTTKFVITSGGVQVNLLEFLGQMRLSGRIPVVTVSEQGEKRSISQNSLIYALYDTIQSQTEGETAQTIRREAKLTQGVPILRSEDEEFRVFYDRAIRPALTYEQKLEAMDFLPVTSRMNKEQGTQYIDAVIDFYTKQGVMIIASEYT